MKKIIKEQYIYESILSLYFSVVKVRSLSAEMISSLDDFFMYYKSEDSFNNSQNYKLIKEIYSNGDKTDMDQLLKRIGFSESTLYRFRVKLIERLAKHFKTHPIICVEPVLQSLPQNELHI